MGNCSTELSSDDFVELGNEKEAYDTNYYYYYYSDCENNILGEYLLKTNFKKKFIVVGKNKYNFINDEKIINNILSNATTLFLFSRKNCSKKHYSLFMYKHE